MIDYWEPAAALLTRDESSLTDAERSSVDSVLAFFDELDGLPANTPARRWARTARLVDQAARLAGRIPSEAEGMDSHSFDSKKVYPSAIGGYRRARRVWDSAMRPQKHLLMQALPRAHVRGSDETCRRAYFFACAAPESPAVPFGPWPCAGGFGFVLGFIIVGRAPKWRVAPTFRLSPSGVSVIGSALVRAGVAGSTGRAGRRRLRGNLWLAAGLHLGALGYASRRRPVGQAVVLSGVSGQGVSYSVSAGRAIHSTW